MLYPPYEKNNFQNIYIGIYRIIANKQEKFSFL